MKIYAKMVEKSENLTERAENAHKNVREMQNEGGSGEPMSKYDLDVMDEVEKGYPHSMRDNKRNICKIQYSDCVIQRG